MRIDRIASLCLARNRLVSSKPSVSILMYHSISTSDESSVNPYYRVATSPKRFREHLSLIKNGGYRVITLTEAVKALGSPTGLGRNLVVLTFDDGYLDFLCHGWPILTEFGFPATVFLPTGFIRQPRIVFNGHECLTWTEVRDLSASGVQFGSHSVSHPVLHRLSWKDIRRELRDSRLDMENRLQTSVTTFAYPYAFPQEDVPFTTRMRHEVREQGFQAMVTTVVGQTTAESDPLCLRRLPVNDEDDSPLLAAKLEGAYDWLRTIQKVSRSLRRNVHPPSPD